MENIINTQWENLINGIKVNMNWLYPKEERKHISINDWDDDECQNLSSEDIKRYF